MKEHWYIDDKEYNESDFWDIYQDALENDAIACADDYISEEIDNDNRCLSFDEAVEELSCLEAEENGKNLYRGIEVHADDKTFQLRCE